MNFGDFNKTVGEAGAILFSKPPDEGSGSESEMLCLTPWVTKESQMSG